MFTIDIREIKENFTKFYGKDDTGIKCCKSGCGIVFYGAGLEKSSLPVGGLSLSVDTDVVVRVKDDKKFDIILSDMNTEYECETENLNEFTGDRFSKSLFKACAMLKGDISGAECLIEYSVNDEKFKRPVISLISALGILNKGKVPDIETVKFLVENIEEEKYSFLPAELYGRKNTLISRRNDGKWEYLPFNISGYKMLISYVDSKGIDIKKKLSQDNMKRYTVNECKRVELIKNEIVNKKGITEEIGKLLSESAYELFDMLGKNAKVLSEMYKISEETGLSVAAVPLYSYCGVCAFVKDEDIDNYIRIFSKEYQKKAGAMPAFCICDSDDSGVLSDIESE